MNNTYNIMINDYNSGSPVNPVFHTVVTVSIGLKNEAQFQIGVSDLIHPTNGGQT